MTTPLEITSQSKEAEIDQSPVKIVLLGVFGVGISLLTTSVFREFLASMLPADFLIWIGLTAAFLIVLALEVMFVKSAGRLTLLMVLNGAVPLALFWNELFHRPHIPLLVGGVLFILFLVIGAQRGWRVLAEGTTVRFALAVRSALSKAVTGMLIFLSVVTYVSYFELHQFTPAAAKNLFESSLVYTEPIVRLWFPNASLNAPAAEFFKQVATSEIASIPMSELGAITGGAATNFSVLPAAMKERVVGEAAAKLRQAFENTYGAIRENEPMKDVLFRLAERSIGDISASMGPAFSVSVTVLLFFALRGIFSLALWFILFLAFLVYKFLVVTGFAYIAVESRSREFVMLS